MSGIIAIDACSARLSGRPSNQAEAPHGSQANGKGIYLADRWQDGDDPWENWHDGPVWENHTNMAPAN